MLSPNRPGNNGGDGLVAARHLVHFGLTTTIVYPKRSTKTHFINLVKQCEDLGINIRDEVPMELSEDQRYDGIVDAIFGFSFSGSSPREPYATAIANMIELQQRQKSILFSVDVPSGWDVNGGDDASTTNDGLLQPDVLISLTVPKLFAKKFHGRHFIGGRFLPPAMAEKYGIRVRVLLFVVSNNRVDNIIFWWMDSLTCCPAHSNMSCNIRN
jgi:hydroxyethylthiazole kinase-like uncharacterized protein yjeF